MKSKLLMGVLLAFAVSGSFAQDPAKTDGDKYKVIMENDRVRVLEYTDKPGEKTTQHHHPDFVLYAIDGFNRKLTFGDGKQVTKELKKGDVIWMKDQIHTGENIGKTGTHALIIELKEPVKAQAPDTAEAKAEAKKP